MIPTTTTPTKNPAAQALGALGGAAGTKAQNAARKVNAQKAGRPRRVCVKCRQAVVGGHADRALDLTCGAHAWEWERAGTKHPAPVNVDRVTLDKIAAHLRAGRSHFAREVVHLVRATGRRVDPKGGR